MDRAAAFDDPYAQVVLAEEELVVIDLQTAVSNIPPEAVGAHHRCCQLAEHTLLHRGVAHDS
eukprot:bmy_13115T0